MRKLSDERANEQSLREEVLRRKQKMLRAVASMCIPHAMPKCPVSNGQKASLRIFVHDQSPFASFALSTLPFRELSFICVNHC